MATETTKKKLQLKELWLLFLENPLNLTDEQIAQLLEAKGNKEFEDLLWRVSRYPFNIKTVQRYRARKEYLAKLSTIELEEIKNGIRESRNAIINATDNEELSDLFFEPPSIDSDEHIVYEILKERGVVR